MTAAPVAVTRAGGRSPGPSASDIVARGLERAADPLREAGVTVPPMGGKLLRPLVAYALVPSPLRSSLDERFWSGALAVQMVHEASLVHDDILDGARERRGAPTLVEARGVGPAVVLGDLYLTGAYRAAAATGSATFLDHFITAVERTVAGEVLQGRRRGEPMEVRAYEEIVTGKSGELFGAAAVLGSHVLGLHDTEERASLGRRLGALYQRVDDLLDYCPAAETGKPPFQDLRQGKWTWVLDLVAPADLETDEREILARLLERASEGSSPARRALELLRREGDALVERAAELSPGDELVARVLGDWVRAAAAGVAAQERAHSRVTLAQPASVARQEVAGAARRLGPPEAWVGYFGRHARTFRLAAHLFHGEAFRSVTGVYAFCRFTDDLVDRPWGDAGPDEVAARWRAWSELAQEAFQGHPTDVPLLDEVMGDTRQAGVDWRYPSALIEGVRMDLTQTTYADWDELERYTFRVAGSVGGWITQLFGLRDPHLLEHAHALGHAMQLTNIVRDVGEDLDRGRLYVPATVLDAHGLTRTDLAELRAGRDPIPEAYVAMLEELMARAERRYEEAWTGIERLPGWYRRPVAAAADGYRAIHDVVRRNGYDTLRRRASTSFGDKVVRGGGAVVRAMTGLGRRPGRGARPASVKGRIEA